MHVVTTGVARKAVSITAIASVSDDIVVEHAWGITLPRSWPRRRRWQCPQTSHAPPWRPLTSWQARDKMSESITVTIAPESERVRLLATTPTQDLLMAILGPIKGAHPRAAATLLEGLALWHQRPLAVVLSVDDADEGSALGLCDALGYGQTLHYEVGLAFPDRMQRGRRRRRRMRGLGSFRDMRELAAWGRDG